MQKVSRLEESNSVWGKAYRKVDRDWGRFRKRFYKRLYPFLQRHWYSEVNLTHPPSKIVESVFSLPEGSVEIDVIEPREKFQRAAPIIPADEKPLDDFARAEYEETEQYVGQLKQGRIFGLATVLTKDHVLLKKESFEFNIYKESDRSIYHRLWLPKLTKLDGSVALVASDDIQNYHHWMFFTVPRIGMVLKSKFVEEQPKFFINKVTTSFHFETLERLSIPQSNLIFCEDYSFVECSNLLVTPTPFFARHSKFAVDFVRETFGAKTGSANRNFYVGRGAAKTRRCLNEDEVIKTLDAWGFEFISMDGRSVAEQAQLMAESRIVVAPHGAALTNIVFMNPGTAVLELTHDHRNVQFFWDLASRADLRYSYIRTDLQPSDNKKLLPFMYDFKVDIERLKQRVSKLLED